MTKKKNNNHYTPVLWSEMNVIIGKYGFNSLGIILDPIATSSIILGKHMQHCRIKEPSKSIGEH